MVMLFCAFIPGILEFPESRVGSHVRRCANVTTDTAFAFRSGTDGSEGHRAIVRQSADFRTGCTPDGRDSACDRNPLTAGRGSAGGSVIVPLALSVVP